MMGALLGLHAVLGLGVIAFGHALGRRGIWLGLLGPVATLVWLATELPSVLDGEAVDQRVSWVGRLGLGLDLRLDGFAALMVLLVSGIGVAVFVYAASYLPASRPGTGRLIGLLTLFSGAMVGLVLSDNLLALYGCWELTSVTSYLLIGNEHDRARARAAALHAILVTVAGGLAMLAGFVIIGQAGGTYRISQLLADPPSGAAVGAGLVLVLLGALTKSAQYPFHSWLPGAMVAPTPVSAYLHSATMVKAGVYLSARFAPAFAGEPVWRPVADGAGAFTMVAGGLRALRQHDLKLILAFGTVSQLGFLMVLFSAGTPEATAAGCELLLAHALFKAALFLVVGMIEHETGTRDIRCLPRLGREWWPVQAVAVVSAASMAGLPLLFGFIAKEEALAALGEGGFGGSAVLLAAVVVGSIGTVAYSARFLWGVFGRAFDPVVAADAGAALTHAAHPPGPGLVVPAAVLATITVLLGVVPGLADRLMTAAASSLDPDVEPVHLALWHGVNQALVLSAVAIAAGLLVFAGARLVDRVLRLGSHVPTGDDVYLWLLRGMNLVADKVTGVVQNGSLPTYAAVILATAAALPGLALAIDGPFPDLPDLVDIPAHLPIVAVLLGASLAAATVTRRFAAALFLGTAGYAMAALFVAQGAPDLALTQVTIETLSTVLFVLGLRRLPNEFKVRTPRGRQVVRTVVALGVGAMVFVFALAASADRPPAAVSAEMVERSVPDGHGRNVVNVILVDFRSFDTLGEMTVLAVAAIGAVALARAGRRPRRPTAEPPPVEPAEPGEEMGEEVSRR